MPAPSRLRSALAAVALSLIAATAGTAARAQAAAPVGCQGPASSTWIDVAVDGVRSSQGLVAVTLYADDAGKFLAHHGSLYTGRVNAEAGTTRVCLFVPRPGNYAIAAYHDEDSSRKLNRSGLGMPTEGFGFSNNPSTFLGIPAFRSVLINVARSDVATRIRLRYP